MRYLYSPKIASILNIGIIVEAFAEIIKYDIYKLQHVI